MTAKNETLFSAVLSQLTVNKIDYNILARDIGALQDTARMQWQYWKKLNVPSLSKSNTTSPEKPAGVKKSNLSPANFKKGKKRGAVIGKKIKEAKQDGSDGSSVVDVEEPIMPTRKLPGRKASVMKFTEESEGYEDMDE